MTEGKYQTVRLLVDGHVHVHPDHDENRLVELALEKLTSSGSGLPTLLLTEVAGANAFHRWREGDSPWKVRRTAESDSIMLDGRLLVIAGRQVVTAERIEVLALATDAEFQDRMPLIETLDQVERRNAIPVLPWGVGKWLGTRGRQVSKIVSERSVFLGDNAGRPTLWPEPALFREHRVLPGSDPLKAAGEEIMAGSYGFFLDCHLDPERPAESIRRSLRSLKTSPERFGRRVGLLQFLTRQIRHSTQGKSSSPALAGGTVGSH